MCTYTTDSAISLEEQRIQRALELIDQWKAGCVCNQRPKYHMFCESFGCSSLDEIAAILRGDAD